MKQVIQKIKFIPVLLLTIACVNCNNDDETVAQSNVVSAFIVEINSSTSNVINFINASQNAETFLWSFANQSGGGSPGNSMLINPTITFEEGGDYLVTLIATDAFGASDVFQQTIVIDDIFDGGLLTNGDFESGSSPWTAGVTNPIPAEVLVTEGDNTFYSVNVTAAGNPFDVNLSHTGLDITQGSTYRLTFDAWSDASRGMVVGIGLSGAPFTNQSVTVGITATRETYTRDLVANFTDNSNSRVIFDMGAETGVVNIDNVSLVLVP